MIDNTKAWYLFIRACILFLDNVLTVSLLYCALVAASTLFPPVTRLCVAPRPVLAWFAVEVAFSFFVFRPRFLSLQSDAVHPDLAPRAQREELFDRVNRHIPDAESYLSKWFAEASRDEIKRENFKEFLRWAFLDAREVREEDEEEIENYTRRTEEKLGRRLPEGRGGAKSLRLTLDVIKFGRRSLLWYMCVGVVDTIASSRLWWQGFHLHRSPYSQFLKLFPLRPLLLLSKYESPVTHLTYWHREHKSKTRLPVLFVHGIGIGLYPYTNFLCDIRGAMADADDGEVGIIALELMPISSRITHAALSKDVMVAEIQTILKYHGWDKVVLVTHSYGSVVATHLIKSPITQSMIGPVVLIDPITFLLHLPDVAHNFTVRKPIRANEYQLWYFGSQDTGVAHTLGRRFFWSENIIWRDELGLGAPDGERGVTVVMAGRDLIVDTKTVSQYLLSPAGEPFGETPKMNGQTNGKANGHANGYANAHTNGHASGKVKALNEKEASLVVARPEKAQAEWKSGLWEKTGLNVLWFEYLDHAQVFDSAKSRRIVADKIRLYSMNT